LSAKHNGRARPLAGRGHKIKSSSVSSLPFRQIYGVDSRLIRDKCAEGGSAQTAAPPGLVARANPILLGEENSIGLPLHTFTSGCKEA